MFTAVLVVGFVGSLLAVSTQMGSHGRVNQETTLALSAALDTIERVRDVDFATLPALHGADFDVPGTNGNPGGLAAAPGDPDGLPGEITVAIDQQSGGVKIYRVTVTVTWRGVAGRRRIALESLVGERR